MNEFSLLWGDVSEKRNRLNKILKIAAFLKVKRRNIMRYLLLVILEVSVSLNELL